MFGDGRLLFSSGLNGKGYRGENCVIDVTEVDELKFVYIDGSSGNATILANPYLRK